MAALGTSKTLDNLEAAFAGEGQAKSGGQHLTAECLHDYSHVRPHSSMNYLTPMQFARRQEAGGARLVKETPPASCRAQTRALTCQKIQLPRGA